MNLQQIDSAIAKQRTTIGRIKVELERTDIRDMQAVRRLRADLEQARLIAIRLDQLRRQETPLDACPMGAGSSSIFLGSNQ
jgi:hypothetical protein